MKKFLPLAFFLLLSSFLFSQQIYQRGLVVKNAGDTVRGWIKYGNWKQNPSKAEFSTDSAGGSPILYTTDQLNYFEITGRDGYKKATVTRDMRPVDPLAISYLTKDTTLTATVFLRVLVLGEKFTLYELVDFKRHYFIQEGTGSIEELSYKISTTRDNPELISEWDDYKDQLRSYAGKDRSRALDNRIAAAGYNESKLSRIVLELNGNRNLAVYGEADKKTKNKPRFFVSGGANFTKLHFTGDNTLRESILNYKYTVNPTFSAGVDISSSRNFADMTLRIELSFSQNTFKGDSHNTGDFYGYPEYETYTVKQTNFFPAVSVLYNFRRTRKVHYFAGAGLAYTFSSYSKNVYTQTVYQTPEVVNTYDHPIDLTSGWMELSLRAGVRLSKHCEVGASGHILGAMTQYVYFSARPQNYSLKFAYFFL